ncbi:vesicular glutamate transporter 3 [Anabrus simplex]|uniref:vesicular glutamate transporter 3 n=1 Tax=Anabrus simplex TaxID=316456 RepID=UPI0035A28CCB
MEESQRFDDPVVVKKYSICSLRRLQDLIPARVVLYFLSFTGFLVSFMMRMDINIAMVAMVKLPPPVIDDNSSSILVCYYQGNGSDDSSDNATMQEGEFDWDSTTQSTILSSFYWCYILSQVAGGVLTQQFGTKAVFGISQFVTAICSLFIPYAASVHYAFIILLRSIQGFASGLTWPAMYAVVGHWIPAIERSRFMSSFQGFSFGIGLTYPLCGFLIAHFGWRVVFYVTGSLGVLWCLMWLLLAFDTPALHPRITTTERNYIENSVGNTVVGDKGLPVPWRAIFTSMPAWSIGITTFGRIWIHYTFIIRGPMYMKTVLGFSIQKNGLLSGLPFLCSYVSSVFFCYLADELVNRNILTLTSVRKIFTATSQIIPGFLLLAIGYLGCNIELVLFAWFLAVTLITASYAGAMASIVDIAPNLAGPILAFAQTIHMSASFLSPLVAGFLLQDNQYLENWLHVFWVSLIVSCVTYIPFQIFGTADIQPWNYPNQKIPVSISELTEPLQMEKTMRKGESRRASGEAAEG